MAAAVRKINANIKGKCLVCPGCGKDVVSLDLCSFVRYYNGDEGAQWCPDCNRYITWRMSIQLEGALPPNSSTEA